MKRNTLVVAVVGVLPMVLGFSSCNGLFQTFSGEKHELNSVSDLAEHVRGVHVESEISKERVRLAVSALRDLTSPDFGGNPEAGYGTFVQAIEASEKQAKVLRRHSEPMMDFAESFFDDWSRDLDDFQAAEMRKRSKERMYATRKLYKSVEHSVGSVQGYLDEINSRLRDYATYLSNDFNASSVASLESDVRLVSQMAAKLDKRLEHCLDATSAYVAETGMHGQSVSLEGAVSSRER